MATPEAVAYEQSLRALDHQVGVLDETRARTGILLAAASIVTSFLGSAALGQSGVDVLAILAVLAFLAAVGLCLWVLVPRRDWRFNLGATMLLEDWADEPRSGDVAAMQGFIATRIEANWRHNRGRIDGLQRLFASAVGFLAIEILLWTIKLA